MRRPQLEWTKDAFKSVRKLEERRGGGGRVGGYGKQVCVCYMYVCAREGVEDQNQRT